MNLKTNILLIITVLVLTACVNSNSVSSFVTGAEVCGM